MCPRKGRIPAIQIPRTCPRCHRYLEEKPNGSLYCKICLSVWHVELIPGRAPSKSDRSAFISWRVRLGLEKARKRGRRMGRPPIPLDMSKVVEMQKSGMSNRGIARFLGVTHTTLQGKLRRLREQLRGSENSRRPKLQIRHLKVFVSRTGYLHFPSTWSVRHG